MLSACTIIAGNYLPFARVLADSFLSHHPGASFTVLVIDDEGSALAAGDDRVRWWRLADLGIDPAERHRLAGIYDVTELATAVKPQLLRALLDLGHQTVVYLDPDIAIYDTIADVAALAAAHGIVLTPHTMEPYPRDDLQVDGFFVLSAGVYNLGFVAVSAAARPFLDWWWQATRREALSDVSRQMFTDQRWVDFVPSFFDHVILKDPGYNVAYWNLHGRTLTAENGVYRVNGVPLRFFHFSGFDPKTPDVLSKHQGSRPRIVMDGRPALARLCHDYAARLVTAGMDGRPVSPYGWERSACGLEMTTRMRRLYWDALMTFERGKGPEPPDPFDRARPEAFLTWLNAPGAQGPPRISRYLHSIYLDRLDLQIQFPDIHGEDAARFVDWIWRDSDLREKTAIDLLPVAGAGLHPVQQPVSPTGVHVNNAPRPVAVQAATDQSVAATLEALLPHLEQMNTLRVAAEDKSFSDLRLTAQRWLFRVLRPYTFQQAQLNTHLIAALRHVAIALRRQEQLHQALDVRVRELTRDLVEAKREMRRIEGGQKGG